MVSKIPQKLEIPEEIQARWQRIVDLMAQLIEVPAALIMRVDPPQIEVFLSSATEANPYRRGERADLNTGLYCETVVRERAPLLVPNALLDPEWDHNPDIKLGMTFYLGYPLKWPDGEIFGTICVLDARDNPRAVQFRSLISEFQHLVERDLCLIFESREREDLLAELQQHRDQLKKMVAEQISELEKSKEELQEQLRYENLISASSASFVNVSPGEIHEKVALVLRRIGDFFNADHCGLFEFLAGPKQVKSVNLYDEGGTRTIPMAVLSSRHPWADHQFFQEKKPVIFSSLEALPPEAGVDRAQWERDGVKAMLMLPLCLGGRVTHLIGLWDSRCPREWPLNSVYRLQFLGEILAKALAHGRDQEMVLKSEQKLMEAERIARLGAWDVDIVSGEAYWSDELYRIFGLLPQEFGPSYEAFLASVHPDDRQAVDQAKNESISDPNRPLSLEHRVIRPDGTVRVVHARGEVLFDQNRRPARLIGTVQDVTEQKQAEEALIKAFDQIKKLKEQLEAENIYLREEAESTEGFKDIIGASNALKYVIYRIQQVAPASTTVLLTGETGTGKGLFARALHQASGRRDKPFVNVNCAGLPPNLIESELFGREKGAFTGSTARQIGRFELANGGTIFLDEIGELPLELQAKLLKVIEAGEFERLGSPHAVKVDVRIIASTNRHLEEEIKRGQFRKDLFYRLNVFPITIPPLRERRKDIPLLVEFFAHRFGKRHGKGIKKIRANTMRALTNYDWPGNVRELINVIERAVIVSDGPELRLAEKIDAIADGPVKGEAARDIEAREAKGLVEVEREHILKALHETGWRIEGQKGAAQLLEMNASTLRARMRKLGIKRPGTD